MHQQLSTLDGFPYFHPMSYNVRSAANEKTRAFCTFSWISASGLGEQRSICLAVAWHISSIPNLELSAARIGRALVRLLALHRTKPATMAFATWNAT